MKELSTKEKAEAYDEAIERAESIYNETAIPSATTKGICTYIFPELIESEDERIRKGLIENFKWFCGDFPETTKWGKDDNLLVKDIIAWLEKHGKIVAYYEDRLDECACKYFNKGYKHALEKQGEQTPAWSEEDDKMFVSIMYSPNFIGEQKDWLKSLKDKYTWKPSDEQMDALEQFISEYKDIDDNSRAYPITHNIESLYNDLKKLKE